MKTLLKRTLGLATVLIAIYLLGLILSVCTISAYPLFRQKDFLMQQTREIAQEYLARTDDAFALWLEGGLDGKTRAIILDWNGNCLLDMTSDPRSAPHLPYEKHLSSVLAGEEAFQLMFDSGASPKLHGLMGVGGTPIVKQGSVVGAVFLIKKTIAITESLAGYAAYFTILYWLSVFFIVSNLRKKKKLDELQQTYIANVTHALKTPVASIKALSETLCDEVESDPDRQKVYYGMILQEANRQDHMIRDVLELSKLQSHGMDFTKTTVPPSAVFDSVYEKYSTLCDCMDISLHFSQAIALLPSLHTNAACVKQVLEILLDNALKFVPEGGSIWLDASVSGKTATICVRDNGIGISKEALPHVFERFYKCSHNFNESGSGLGLAIAREIIAGLKEKIWAESEPEKGSFFYFTVRLK